MRVRSRIGWSGVATIALTAGLLTSGGAVAQAAGSPASLASSAPSASPQPTSSAVPPSSPVPTPAAASTGAPSTDAPAPSVAPTDGTSAPTTAPTPSAPPLTQTPAPDASAPGTPTPTLEQMNAAHNHSMGSTLDTFEPATASSATQRLFSVQAKSLAAAAAPTTSILGMDISGWQPNVDWNAAYANGARFVYIKATESNDYTSSSFSGQYNGATAVGMIRGAYHFANPNQSTGAVQANYFVDNGGGWSADGKTLPPMLDIEYDPYTASDGTNSCYGLSQAQMVAWIADFSKTVLSRTGRAPAIYTTTSWWSTCTGNNSSFGANPLIIARWTDISAGPGVLPASWSTWSVWQYADAGVFPGDQDLFNGSYSALQAFATGSAAPPTSVAMSQPIIGGTDFNGDKKPDLLARKPDGTLWFYAGTGASGTSAGYAAGIQVGVGWDIFNEIIAAGDVNGDGKSDVLARKPDGTLWLYPVGKLGTPTGFGLGVQVGPGWNVFTDIIAAGDVNGDGKADLLARKPDGSLWLYAGTGVYSAASNGYQAGVQLGVGWNVFNQVVGVGDVNHDGHDDLVGLKSDGSLWYYAGTGSTYFSGVSTSASGISATDLLIAGGDANGDGIPDLLTRTSTGALDFFAGAATPQAAFGGGQQVGSGWNVFRTVIGSGDLNGDGTPDVIGVGADGALVFYGGVGSAGGINKSYRAGMTIGSGWGMFSKVIDGGDFDGDGNRDLIGVGNDGTLWLYRGLGSVTPGAGGYSAGIQIGYSGWGAFTQLVTGDFNGDHHTDVLAFSSDGSMRLYPGVARASSSAAWFGAPAVIGSSSWNAYNSIVAVTDGNGDGLADLIATKPDGSLWFFAGSGTMNASHSGLGTPLSIGSGWTIFNSVGDTRDANSGRTADLLATRPDGTLWYYPGTGLIGTTTGSFAPAVVAGSGWSVFS
jgi:GH25 family lysozyme M1 (1,4-beta-N-acetylmuramidase)